MCSRYTKACWADFPETASLRVKVEYNTWRDSREREPFHYLCDMAGERYRPQVVRDWLWRLLFWQRANNCALQETGHESLSQRCVIQGHARKQRSSICSLRSHLARTLYCTLRHQVPCTPHMMKQVCDACDERGNFEGCRYACFLSVADVGTILPVVMKPRKPRWLSTVFI